jgi:hypothetical protein
MTPTDAIGEPVGELDHDRCLVHGTGEIRAYLQRLFDARCILSGQADGTTASQVTALLHVGDASLLIDVPRGKETLRQWLESPRLRFESSLERISVGFVTGPVWLDQHEGQPALGLPLPTRLHYRQRREYLRVAPPMGALRCQLPLRQDDETTWVDAAIGDIGGGGLALLMRADAMPLAVGDVLEGCQVHLPQCEPVAIDLVVRHVVARCGHGPPVVQAGCEFVDLPRALQDRLFRYLMQLDRERVSRRRTWE